MYDIFLSSSAVKDYKKISDSEVNKINKIIDALANNPRPAGCKKLKNRNAYRIRTGNYRIIYEIKDKALNILIIRIRNRKDVYNKLPK